MDPNIQTEHLEKPNNMLTSKRPKNKTKEKHANSSAKPKYYLPKQDHTSTDPTTNRPADIEP